MNIFSAATQPLDHIGIAVHSIEESHSLFELISGKPCSQPELLEEQGVRVVFTGTIELLEPLGPDTTVGRFLKRRGQALHHIAFRTPDLPRELERLEATGFRLIDRIPRPGANGHLVAFLHPSSTGGVLVELVQNAS